jgi:hypothetical protein
MRDPRSNRCGGAALIAGLVLGVAPARAQFAPPLAPPLSPDQAKLAYQQASKLYGDPAHPNLSAPPGYEFAEYVCGENQRNASEANGLTKGDGR